MKQDWNAGQTTPGFMAQQGQWNNNQMQSSDGWGTPMNQAQMQQQSFMAMQQQQQQPQMMMVQVAVPQMPQPQMQQSMQAPLVQSQQMASGDTTPTNFDRCMAVCLPQGQTTADNDLMTLQLRAAAELTERYED